ncbi:MAG: cyclase family protein [Microbacteriaceae bacterium]|nr:cyclase family protein [Microbacteriaceae bacterium]
MTASPLLAELTAALASGAVRVVDLTNTLSATTPALRLPEPFVNLDDFSLERAAAFEPTAPMWQHNNFRMGEHVGTHIDAPIHWISGRDGLDVSQLDPARLVGPAVVLDFSAEAAENPDWVLEIDDVRAWEAEHGPLPENSWLLLRTGWDQYSHDEAQFLNADETGSHTPGISASCAKWLAEEAPLSGLGVETVGIDAGGAGAFDPPFPVHYHLLGHDKYGITSLQRLAELPATGAIIVVSPLPIVGGSGAPCRVFAFVGA